MNKTLYFHFFSFLCLMPLWTLHSEPLKLKVHAEGAILMNAESGAVLFEKNAHHLFHPASITKAAAALYALKLKSECLDEMVVAEGDDISVISEEVMRKASGTIPPYRLTYGGTHIGLRKGEKMTFRDLLYGMMLDSGNDASNVIARFAGGTIPQFMFGLNAYLKEIHCTNTRFMNPHGLFHPEHQTTPYDMAIMTREALKVPEFCKIVATSHYPRPKTNMQESWSFVQHNKLLRNGRYKYPKAIGVKTGYHSQAENTLIAAARHEGRTLIAVLMKTKERSDMFLDAIHLFEASFNQAKVSQVFFPSGHQEFSLKVKGASQPIKTYLENSLSVSYYPAEESVLKCFLEWDDVKAPIQQGQRVGIINIQTSDGRMLASALLFAEDSIPQTWLDWFYSLFR
jgi:D-alanyl-D-alanine carboxypeptidase (penicillin-binding protein 5/6)